MSISKETMMPSGCNQCQFNPGESIVCLTCYVGAQMIARALERAAKILSDEEERSYQEFGEAVQAKMRGL